MTSENGDEKVYLNINSYRKGYQVILLIYKALNYFRVKYLICYYMMLLFYLLYFFEVRMLLLFIGLILDGFNMSQFKNSSNFVFFETQIISKQY